MHSKSYCENRCYEHDCIPEKRRELQIITNPQWIVRLLNSVKIYQLNRALITEKDLFDEIRGDDPSEIKISYGKFKRYALNEQIPDGTYFFETDCGYAWSEYYKERILIYSSNRSFDHGNFLGYVRN